MKEKQRLTDEKAEKDQLEKEQKENEGEDQERQQGVSCQVFPCTSGTIKYLETGGHVSCQRARKCPGRVQQRGH